MTDTASPAKRRAIEIASGHLALLLDPQNWRDNPFSVRDARRDAHRRQPAKSLAWMFAVLLLIAGGAAIGLHYLVAAGYGVPWFVGGAAGTALCAVVCGVHVHFISGAAHKHTGGMIARESHRNTLASLLSLPIPPLQMLLQASVYPWLAGMRMAAAGLPFYAFCVALGGLRWLDVALLYLVYALLAFLPPIWNTPVLSDSAPPAVANPQAAQASRQQQQQASGSSPALGMMYAFLIPAFLFPTILAASRGGVGGLYTSFHRYLPDSLLTLAPSVFVSWPLLAARALITPLDWFGLPVPPILFVPPLFLLGRYIGMMRSARFLLVGTYRDLVEQPDYLYGRALLARTRFAKWLVVTGYLWRWGVVDGGLAPVIRAPSSGMAGFVGLAALLISIPFLISAGSAGAWSRRPRGESRKPVLPWSPLGRAVRHSARPLANLALFVGVCLLLSRTFAPRAVDLAPAAKMLAILVAGGVLCFAANRTLGGASFLGIFLPLIVLFGPPELRPLASFSPTLGLAGFLDPSTYSVVPYLGPALSALYRQPPAWQSWVAACLGAAGLLLVWSRPARRPAGAEEKEPRTLDPTIVGLEPLQDPAVGAPAAGQAERSPLSEKIIAAVQRLGDNAVAVKELRARLRGRLHPGGIRRTALFLFVVTAILAGSPQLTSGFGGLLSRVLYPAVGTGRSSADLLSCWYIALTWLAIIAGTTTMTLAFAPEREKSTLGFLLTTPIRAPAIVVGKLIGLAIPSCLTLCLILLWTLMLTIVEGPALGLGAGLEAWLRMALTAASIVLATGCACLALGALFPKWTQTGCVGILNWMLIQIPIQLAIQRPGRFRGPVTPMAGGPSVTVSADLVWLAVIGALLLIAVAGFGLAVWGVRRMRRGDIAFEASKREN